MTPFKKAYVTVSPGIPRFTTQYAKRAVTLCSKEFKQDFFHLEWDPIHSNYAEDHGSK